MTKGSNIRHSNWPTINIYAAINITSRRPNYVGGDIQSYKVSLNCHQECHKRSEILSHKWSAFRTEPSPFVRLRSILYCSDRKHDLRLQASTRSLVAVIGNERAGVRAVLWDTADFLAARGHWSCCCSRNGVVAVADSGQTGQKAGWVRHGEGQASGGRGVGVPQRCRWSASYVSYGGERWFRSLGAPVEGGCRGEGSVEMGSRGKIERRG